MGRRVIIIESSHITSLKRLCGNDEIDNHIDVLSCILYSEVGVCFRHRPHLSSSKQSKIINMAIESGIAFGISRDVHEWIRRIIKNGTIVIDKIEPGKHGTIFISSGEMSV